MFPENWFEYNYQLYQNQSKLFLITVHDGFVTTFWRQYPWTQE
jgi:hypothetical protein